MNPLILACVAAGAATVVQGALNRRIAGEWGDTPAVLLNGIVLSVCAGLAIWLTSRSDWPLATALSPKAGAFARPAWWYVVPGVLGFGFVMTLPGAIARLGASQVFVSIVAGQMVAGLLWDVFVDHISASGTRLAGVALVLVGAWLATRSS